jgi:hypothetical protein
MASAGLARLLGVSVVFVLSSRVGAVPVLEAPDGHGVATARVFVDHEAATRHLEAETRFDPTVVLREVASHVFVAALPTLGVLAGIVHDAPLRVVLSSADEFEEVWSSLSG